MDYSERSKLVARLLAGFQLVRPSGGRVYRLLDPTPEVRYLAEDAYHETLAACRDLMTEGEAVDLSRRNGRWTDAKEAQLARAEADVADLKVGLYENYKSEAERAKWKNRLRRCREIASALSADKLFHAGRTREHVAASHKLRVLTGLCLLTAGGEPVFRGEPSDWQDADLVDAVIELTAGSQPSEGELREVARTAPWQGYWSVGGPNPFGRPAGELGEAQVAVCSFSVLYDRVRENPDRPPDEVIQDDDALDGWVIAQRRKNSGDRDERGMVGSERVAGCQEVFVMVTPEQASKHGLSVEEYAEKVENMNSFESRRVKAKRMRQIRAEGKVEEIQLADVRHELVNRALTAAYEKSKTG